MRLTLEACPHVKVTIYGDEGRGTCLTCYRRLRAVAYQPATNTIEWRPDTPVAVCNHPNKKPIPDTSVRRKAYHDAMCRSCGCVLRHPNGPGTWREVIFNGLVIKEEPF